MFLPLKSFLSASNLVCWESALSLIEAGPQINNRTVDALRTLIEDSAS